MSFRFDLYVDRPSWLHRLDPRTKLALVGSGVVLLLLYRNLWLIVGFLALAHLVLLSARIPWSRLALIWRLLLPVSALIFALWPIFYPGEGPALLEVWLLRVTTLRLVEGLAVALRIDALAFFIFVLLLTTDQAVLVRGLVKLGMPYSWGLTLAIALRYVPTFFGTFGAISDAQQARGLILGRGDFVGRLRSYMPILVAMIINALRLIDNLAMALEARGFGAPVRRTYLRDLRLRPPDRVLLALTAAVFLVLLVARLGYGLGAHPLSLI